MLSHALAVTLMPTAQLATRAYLQTHNQHSLAGWANVHEGAGLLGVRRVTLLPLRVEGLHKLPKLLVQRPCDGKVSPLALMQSCWIYMSMQDVAQPHKLVAAPSTGSVQSKRCRQVSPCILHPPSHHAWTHAIERACLQPWDAVQHVPARQVCLIPSEVLQNEGRRSAPWARVAIGQGDMEALPLEAAWMALLTPARLAETVARRSCRTGRGFTPKASRTCWHLTR